MTAPTVSSLAEDVTQLLAGTELPSFSQDELLTLLDISQTLNSTLELSKILDHILMILSEVVLASASSIWLLDPGNQTLGVASATGARRDEVKKIQMRVGQGIVGWVVKEGVPFLTSDARGEPQHAREVAEMLDYEGRSILCVPMRCHNRVIGAIQVINRQDGSSFGEKDVFQLVLCANMTGIAIENARLYEASRSENRALRRELGYCTFRFEDIIGESPKMRELADIAQRVAATNSTILLRGESGTGKELIAQAVHMASRRSKGPFIPVNCAALPDTLLESELFGHEKGSFTGAIGSKEGRFELANGGTIFLDEIGDMPYSLQVKLLRVLQERRFERVGGTKSISTDVRVIAATHQDLDDLIREGTFREDLFYRLNVISIYLPPLRERVGDVPVLAEHFFSKYTAEINPRLRGFSPEAMNVMEQYSWSGNVRELENAVEYSVVLAKGDWIEPADLPIKLHTDERHVHAAPQSLEAAQREFKRDYVTRILQMTDGNRSQAAKVLEIQRTYLSRLIKELDIDM